MPKRSALIFILPFAASCLPSQGATVATGGSDVQCQVRASEVEEGIMLAGVANADRPVSGVYHFSVIKKGAAGSSNVSQGGEFTAEPGKDTALGTVKVSVEPGASYAADLTLEWDGKSTVCRAQYPMER